MKYIGSGSAAQGGVLASSVMLLIATLAGAPAFAKSDAKKSKPEKARVERARGGDSSTRFTAVYGTKALNKTDWAPADKQTGFGLDVEYVNEDWPAAVVAYYFKGDASGKMLDLDVNQDGASDGDFKASTETTELVSVSLKSNTCKPGRFRLCVGFLLQQRILGGRRTDLSGDRHAQPWCDG